MNANSITRSDMPHFIDAHTRIFPDNIAGNAKERVSGFYGLPIYAAGTLAELYMVRNKQFQNRKIVILLSFCADIANNRKELSI